MFLSAAQMFLVLYVKCLILTKFGFPGQILKKVSSIEFHKNPSSKSRVCRCGRTDGRTNRTYKGNRHFLATFVKTPASTTFIWPSVAYL
jgi:hypothetical protein